MLLNELTWTDVRELLKNNPVVIVPTGSTEQHGPHLPLMVDIASAYEVAKAVGKKTGALVTPPLNFGYSEMWDTFPGTISFKNDTFKAAISDIAHSLIRGGFRKILFLNGHNPNLPVLQEVLLNLIDRFEDEGVMISVGSYFLMAKEEYDEIGDNFRDGTHANELETSFLLHLRPELVKMDRMKGWGDKYECRMIISYEGGAMTATRGPQSSDTEIQGTFGNPELASAERGKRYFETAVEKISTFVDDMREGRISTQP